MARKEKEVKKLADAEQRARALLDQTSSSASVHDTRATADAAQQADSLRSELQAAEQERARLAQRCELLEAEARELRNDHKRMRPERSETSQVTR